jgi:membrane-bound lytic murein transglycosylase D
VATDGSEAVKTYYRVRRGDTLASIARMFRTSVSLLQTWNNLPGSRIVAGSRLTIYTTRTN